MKHFLGILIVVATSLPFTAGAQQRLTEAELLQRAIEENTCNGFNPVRAVYDEQNVNRVLVTCSDVATTAGTQQGLGLGGVGAGVAGLILVAVMSGGSTPATTGTN